MAAIAQAAVLGFFSSNDPSTNAPVHMLGDWAHVEAQLGVGVEAGLVDLRLEGDGAPVLLKACEDAAFRS